MSKLSGGSTGGSLISICGKVKVFQSSLWWLRSHLLSARFHVDFVYYLKYVVGPKVGELERIKQGRDEEKIQIKRSYRLVS